MMTILDEEFNESKYNHILFVEFCEWIARIAFKLYDNLSGRSNIQKVNQIDCIPTS